MDIPAGVSQQVQKSTAETNNKHRKMQCTTTISL